MERVCDECAKVFESPSGRSNFCSNACRAAASRARHRGAVEEELERAAQAVSMALAILRGQEAGRRR